MCLYHTDGLKQTVIRPGQTSSQDGTLVSLGTQVSLSEQVVWFRSLEIVLISHPRQGHLYQFVFFCCFFFVFAHNYLKHTHCIVSVYQIITLYISIYPISIFCKKKKNHSKKSVIIVLK